MEKSKFVFKEATYPVKGTVMIDDNSGEEDWRDLWRTVELNLDAIQTPKGVISYTEGFLWDRNTVLRGMEDVNKPKKTKKGMQSWETKITEFIENNCSDGKNACFFPMNRITHTLECGEFKNPDKPFQVINKWYTNPPKMDGKKLQVSFYGKFDTLRDAKKEVDKILNAPERSTYDDDLTVEKVLSERECEIRETSRPESKPYEEEDHLVKGDLVSKKGGRY